MSADLPVTLPPRSLHELHPACGEAIAVQLHAPRKRFSLKLLGYKENGAVMVTAPSSAGLPLALEGTPVVARLMAGNFFCTFTSRIIKVHQQPFAHWHLAYPDVVEYQRVRKHDRIPVNLSVSVDHQDDLKSVQAGLPRILHCHDIGLGGLAVEASSPLGQVGEHFFITLRFQLDTLDQVVLLPAELRNCEETELGVFSHGMAFTELEEDSQLLLMAFVYQQYLTELGYLE